MKIVVTGSLGNVSKPLAEVLIARGHNVVIISSDNERRSPIESLGAAAAIGSVTDVPFLRSAFNGADAVYAMIPPDYAATDALAHYRQVAGAYAKALKESGVKKVVHLSSWGADLEAGTGYIRGSHSAEGILDNIPGVAVTHVRAGFIYYNLYYFIGMIRATGMIAANYGGQDRIVMVSPLDIAEAVAEELLSDSNSSKVRYIASDDRTAAEIANALGVAIGKPDLEWNRISNEQQIQNMERLGIPPHVIENTVQLGSSIHNGNLRRHFDQTGPHVFGKVKLEDFAREFAAAYNKA